MINLGRAFRRLLSAPTFSLAALLTLALGIGANALAFSALRGLILHPLPFPDADRIAWIQPRNPAFGTSGDELSWEEANAVARSEAFDDVAVIGPRSLIRENGQERIDWRGLRVTATLADVLRIQPFAGTRFSAEHMSMATASAMMLGYERWQQDFGGDPAVIGKVLHFGDRKAHTVVGILPPALEFPIGRAPRGSTGSGYETGRQDFWLLGQERPDDYPDGAVLVRMRPDVTRAQAASAVETVSGALTRKSATAGAPRSLSLVPLRDHTLGLLKPALPLVQGFSALLMLIACANLANLALARGLTLRSEFAVRSALGARRRDIIGITMAESAIVSAAGLGLGLALAAIGRSLLMATASGRVALIDRVRLDGVVVLFASALSVAVMIAFGLLPVFSQPAGATAAMFERGSRTQTASRRYFRVLNGLVIAQVGITLVLLTGAALLVQSLSRLLAVDTGYDRRQVVAADVLLPEAPKQFVPYFRRLHARLRSLPGVEAVGLIQSTPLTSKWTFREPMVLPDRLDAATNALLVPGSFVAFDYFEAMKIPVIAGRTFTEKEFLAPDPPAIIINDIAARALFPRGDAVGRKVVMFGSAREIIGVVKATRDVRLETAAEPQWYQPLFVGGSQVLVRTSTDPRTFAATLRQELRASDPRLIIRKVEPLEDIVLATVFERRLAMQVVTAFAALALALAVVGLYGVLSFSVVQRRREFGIRAALGARPRDLLVMVVSRGAGLTLAGIAIGGACASLLARSLRTLLFETTVTDPSTYVGTALILGTVAVLASTMPAWQAASADPSIALRAD